MRITNPHICSERHLQGLPVGRLDLEVLAVCQLDLDNLAVGPLDLEALEVLAVGQLAQAIDVFLMAVLPANPRLSSERSNRL